jgi:exopolysaccharide production protein ExoY
VSIDLSTDTSPAVPALSPTVPALSVVSSPTATPSGLSAVAPWQLGVKRTLDIVVASVALIVVLPLVVLIAALVKASSQGPVFFRQERVGRDGRRFKCVKFRSMVNGADRIVQECDETRARYIANDFKLGADDPRITKVGRVLRATSLDELPQLVNVLAGHMSIVGNRPLLAPELALRSDYHQHCYRALRPGMTGLWQVEGRSTVAHADRHRLDQQYIETWSNWSDVKILARTPFAVLRFHHSR